MISNFNNIYKYIYYIYYRRRDIQARLAKNRKIFGQHLSRDYCPPGHENPAMGYFWGVDHH